MKEAASVLAMGVVATILSIAAAYYTVAGKVESDPKITRSAPISD
jgi:hypothetical protein